MEELRIFTKYLFPVMLQIIIIALIAFILKNRGMMIGYESVLLAGIVD